MANEPALSLRRLSDEQLNGFFRRMVGWARVAWLCMIGCVVLGIWRDWRWFPTAVIPFCVIVFAGYAINRCQDEAARRRAVRHRQMFGKLMDTK